MSKHTVGMQAEAGRCRCRFGRFGAYVTLSLLAGTLGALLLIQCSLNAQATGGDLRATNSLGVLVAFHNFGTVSVTQSFSHEFTWRNDSTNPVVVRGVNTSCDCLQVTSFPSVIAPGGEEKLTVTANPKTPGPIDWLVFMRVEGSSAPILFCLSGLIEIPHATNPPSEFLIAPKALLKPPPHPPGVTFVDVRSQAQFRVAHIPGSLNLPLFTVKTMGFLRSKRVILLNEGHSSADLLLEALRLKQFQFASVEVLDGGLRTWQQVGGVMEGENTNTPALATIGAQQFDLTRGDSGWLVIAVDTTQPAASSTPLPIAATIPFDSASFATDIAAVVKQHPEVRRLLVVTPLGGDYQRMEPLLRGIRDLPVFYLAGGTAAYTQYFGQEIAMQNRKRMTISSQDQTKARFSGGGRPAGRTGGCCGSK